MHSSDTTRPSCPRVLSIAGTDPTGGAGIHADLKSITVAGGYAMGVVTAILSQNTCGVSSIHFPPAQVIRDQLDAVASDVQIDAVKLGMMANCEYIETVSAWLDQVQIPVVLIDPVMVATSGDRLLAPEAEDALKELVKKATVITPNTRELEVLADLPIGTITDYPQAEKVSAQVAKDYGVQVVVKGGHLKDPLIWNAIVDSSGVLAKASAPRSSSSSTHGTGCSLSSALATRLAIGNSLEEALRWCTDWLAGGVERGQALQIGKGDGHGPLDHSFQLRRFAELANCAPEAVQYCTWPGLETPQESDQKLQQVFDSKVLDDPDFAPQIAPAGPWTKQLWYSGKQIFADILQLPFSTQLQNGTLDQQRFTFYQAQDAIYLDNYGKMLSTLATKAPDNQQMAFWANAAVTAVMVEKELHHHWLSNLQDAQQLAMAKLPASPVTLGYVNFLLSTSAYGSYPVAVAASLPCAWLYAEIGLRYAQSNHPDHPFHEWLETYSDQAFIDETKRWIEFTEQALSSAEPRIRAEAFTAYLGACQWEYHFFDQAHRLSL